MSDSKLQEETRKALVACSGDAMAQILAEMKAGVMSSEPAPANDTPIPSAYYAHPNAGVKESEIDKKIREMKEAAKAAKKPTLEEAKEKFRQEMISKGYREVPANEILSESIQEEEEPEVDQEDFEEAECPQCGGPGIPLGNLGNTMHWRCRNCGVNFTERPLDSDEKEDFGADNRGYSESVNEEELTPAAEILQMWDDGTPSEEAARNLADGPYSKTEVETALMKLGGSGDHEFKTWIGSIHGYIIDFDLEGEAEPQAAPNGPTSEGQVKLISPALLETIPANIRVDVLREMATSKKDYVAIAKILRHANGDPHMIHHGLAAYFHGDNPKFDPKKFHKAAGTPMPKEEPKNESFEARVGARLNELAILGRELPALTPLGGAAAGVLGTAGAVAAGAAAHHYWKKHKQAKARKALQRQIDNLDWEPMPAYYRGGLPESVDEDLTTANVGNTEGGPAQVTSAGKVSIQKDLDETFSIVIVYEDGSATVLEAGIPNEEEANNLLADYQDMYGGGEDYRAESTMRPRISTKNMIEYIARNGGKLNERALDLFLEDEDVGVALPTPDVGPALDINPAEEPDTGEQDVQAHPTPVTGPATDPQGTIPEQEPGVDGGPTADPFAAQAMAAGDNSPEDAQWLESIGRRHRRSIRERLNAVLGLTEDEQPPWLKKDGEDEEEEGEEEREEGEDEEEEGEEEEEEGEEKEEEGGEEKSESRVNEVNWKRVGRAAIGAGIGGALGAGYGRLIQAGQEKGLERAAKERPEMFTGKYPKKYKRADRIGSMVGGGLGGAISGGFAGATWESAEGEEGEPVNEFDYSKAPAAVGRVAQKVAGAVQPLARRALQSPVKAAGVAAGAGAAALGAGYMAGRARRRESTEVNETPQFDQSTIHGMRASMVMGSNVQPAQTEYKRESISNQFVRAFRAFNESIQEEENDPASMAATNPGATPDAQINPNQAPENANNANPPMKEGRSRSRSKRVAEDRFRQARYAKVREEDEPPFPPKGKEDSPPGEGGEVGAPGFYTPPLDPAAQAAQDLQSPNAELDSLANLEGDQPEPDQTSFNMPPEAPEVEGEEENEMGEEEPGTEAPPEKSEAPPEKKEARVARRFRDPLAEESFEEFMEPLKSREDLIKHKVESLRRKVEGRRPTGRRRIRENDIDNQLQQGTVVYARGVEEVPDGTRGEISFQLPTSEGYLYLCQFEGLADGKLVRHDQLSVV